MEFATATAPDVVMPGSKKADAQLLLVLDIFIVVLMHSLIINYVCNVEDAAVLSMILLILFVVGAVL